MITLVLVLRHSIEKRSNAIISSYFPDDGYEEVAITTPSPMLSALPDSPSPTGFNESTMSQSMWADEIEYVELDKEDRGLGFSILDYKVSYMGYFNQGNACTCILEAILGPTAK